MDIQEILNALSSLPAEQKKQLFNQLDPAEVKALTGEAVRTGNKAYNAVLSEKDRLIEELKNTLSQQQQRLNEVAQSEVAKKEAELNQRIEAIQQAMEGKLGQLQLQLAREKTLRNYQMDETFEEMVVGQSPEEIAERAQKVYERYQAFTQKMEQEILSKYGVDPNKGKEEKTPPKENDLATAFKVDPKLLEGLNEQQLALLGQALAGQKNPAGEETAPETIDNSTQEMLRGISTEQHGFSYINNQLAGRANVAPAGVSPAMNQVPAAQPRVDANVVKNMGPDDYRNNRQALLNEAGKELATLFKA